MCIVSHISQSISLFLKTHLYKAVCHEQIRDLCIMAENRLSAQFTVFELYKFAKMQSLFIAKISTDTINKGCIDVLA